MAVLAKFTLSLIVPELNTETMGSPGAQSGISTFLETLTS